MREPVRPTDDLGALEERKRPCPAGHVALTPLFSLPQTIDCT
jgi:hypothetical protein